MCYSYLTHKCFGTGWHHQGDNYWNQPMFSNQYQSLPLYFRPILYLQSIYQRQELAAGCWVQKSHTTTTMQRTFNKWDWETSRNGTRSCWADVVSRIYTQARTFSYLANAPNLQNRLTPLRSQPKTPWQSGENGGSRIGTRYHSDASYASRSASDKWGALCICVCGCLSFCLSMPAGLLLPESHLASSICSR
jgi:hypothetical protein